MGIYIWIDKLMESQTRITVDRGGKREEVRSHFRRMENVTEAGLNLRCWMFESFAPTVHRKSLRRGHCPRREKCCHSDSDFVLGLVA